MKLIWTAESFHNIETIVDYILSDDPVAALAPCEKIFSTVETILPENPYAGRPGRVEGTRELVVHASYIVVYEIENDISIPAVRHAARLWPGTYN